MPSVSPLVYPEPVVSDASSFASAGYLDLTPYKKARLFYVLADAWNVPSKLSIDGNWNPARTVYCRFTFGKTDYVVGEGLQRFQKQILLTHSAHENLNTFLEASTSQAVARLGELIPIVEALLRPTEMLLDAPEWIAIKPSQGALIDVRVISWDFPTIPEIGIYPTRPAQPPKGAAIPANGNPFPPSSDTGSGGESIWNPSDGGDAKPGLPSGAGTPEKPTDRTGVWWVHFGYFDACVYKTLWKSLGDDEPSSQPRQVSTDLGVVQNPCGAVDKRIDFYRDSTFLTYGTGGNLTALELRYVLKGTSPS